ncbi:hypothetical protein HYE14_02440 [Mycoplasmopsis bovis]|nr:hypothetical protein [Mycoplasmopsis bovis]QQH25827.1 hypothetical protein HYE14_02440 [Mycoplasmopsis bovis]
MINPKLVLLIKWTYNLQAQTFIGDGLSSIILFTHHFNFNSSISTGSDLHWRWNYHPLSITGLVIILESLLMY